MQNLYWVLGFNMENGLGGFCFLFSYVLLVQMMVLFYTLCFLVNLELARGSLWF